uniref:Uncharacterized protein n=1 Tax=Ditylenchus dipsaci TaxID=166011 RepID=A0A915DSP2_9BILA
MKLSLCWDQVAYLQESMSGGSCSNSSQFRAKILDAVTSMHNALGVRDIVWAYITCRKTFHADYLLPGRMHHVPLTYSNGTSYEVDEDGKTDKKKAPCSALDFLCKELFNILNFFESSQIPLDPGLYISYLRLQSSLNVIRVTVPENVPSVLPFALVRSNPHVSEEEWEWLRLIDQKPFPSKASPLQVAFHQQLGKAAAVLINDLDMEIDLIQKHRLYRLQVLQLHSDVSFILIMPRAEDVCNVSCPTSEDSANEHFKGCTSIPIPVFQMINLFTYQPDFIAAYCRLSIFLEHFIMVLQYEQRQCLLENDSKQLDEIWRSSRWISNIASVARDRDRQNNCSLLLTSILEPLSPTFFQLSDEFTDVGYHSDNSINIANRHFQKSSGMDGKVAINGSSNAPLRNNPLRKSKVGPESCSSPSDYHFNRSRRHSEKLHKNPLKFEQSKVAFGDAKAKLQSMDSDCLVQNGHHKPTFHTSQYQFQTQETMIQPPI